MITRLVRDAARFRLLYGLTLLAFPRSVLRLAGVRRQAGSGSLTAVVRVLGARHAVEAIALERVATRRGALVGATVDGVHAASLVALARLFPARARLARADGAIALGFALTTAGCVLPGR
jgi:hypothetical protein